MLHDVAGRDRRSKGTSELLGWMLERGFIGLDLSFAPTAELRWGERGPALLTYLPRAHSLGAARLLHDGTLSEDGKLLAISSRGRGVVAADSLSAGPEPHDAGGRGGPRRHAPPLRDGGRATADSAGRDGSSHPHWPLGRLSTGADLRGPRPGARGAGGRARRAARGSPVDRRRLVK